METSISCACGGPRVELTGEGAVRNPPCGPDLTQWPRHLTTAKVVLCSVTSKVRGSRKGPMYNQGFPGPVR